MQKLDAEHPGLAGWLERLEAKVKEAEHGRGSERRAKRIARRGGGLFPGETCVRLSSLRAQRSPALTPVSRSTRVCVQYSTWLSKNRTAIPPLSLSPWLIGSWVSSHAIGSFGGKSSRMASFELAYAAALFLLGLQVDAHALSRIAA